MRVRFTKERGRITQFLVQLECVVDDEWYIIMRYDTAHDFAHCDVLHPDGTEEKTALATLDYNEAFTFAQFDLRSNWKKYRDRYERWMNT